MQESNGLVAAYLLDGSGGAVTLDWQGVRQWQPAQGVLWLHLDYTHPTAVEWLQAEPSIPQVVAESLTASESRPRGVVIGDGLFVSLRSVNLNPQADPEDMVALRAWIQADRIVTTRRRRLYSVDDVRESLAGGSGPKSAPELLLALAFRMSDRINDVVTEIEDDVDALQEQTIGQGTVELRIGLANVRRQIVALRRYLAPQREAVTRLFMEHVAWLSDTDRTALRELADRTTRIVEDLDLARERAAVTQEELAGRLAEQLNQRMYVLSLVAALFLPLGFVTGLLGINVGGIPLAESGAGFLIVCGVLAVCAAVVLVWLRVKRWF